MSSASSGPGSSSPAPTLASDPVAGAGVRRVARRRLWAPRHWPAWLAVGFFAALARLPFPLLWLLGHGLGRLGYLVLPDRRRVARTNLALCLPALSAWRREALVRQHFGWLGVAAVSQGIAWHASPRRLRRLVRFRDEAEILGLLRDGRGVIVLTPHFVALDLAGPAFAERVHPGLFMYQRIRSPVIDAVVQRGRTRFGSVPVERRDDLRGPIRRIRKGAPFYYLPDQDPGRKRGIFVPFCGVAAATVPMLGRIARLADAPVVPTFATFLPWGRGVEMRFGAALAGFPSGDDNADTARMNQVIEAGLQATPAQYFWVHRRFKTRPEGAAPIYPPSRRDRRRPRARAGSGA
jgi:KDO2-lipid IV(A) lauroyltransferase